MQTVRHRNFPTLLARTLIALAALWMVSSKPDPRHGNSEMTIDVLLGEDMIEFNSRHPDQTANTLVANPGRITSGKHSIRVRYGTWVTCEYLTRFSSVSFRDGIVNAVELNPQTAYATPNDAKKILLNGIDELRKLSFYSKYKRDKTNDVVDNMFAEGGVIELRHEPVLASLYFKRISGVPNSELSLERELPCILVELRFALDYE